MGVRRPQVDFFISYTAADQAWAEWIAWQLKDAGSSLVLQARDMVAGLNLVHQMQKTTTTAKRTIAVLRSGGVGVQVAQARLSSPCSPATDLRRLRTF